MSSTLTLTPTTRVVLFDPNDKLRKFVIEAISTALLAHYESNGDSITLQINEKDLTITVNRDERD